MTPPPTPTDIRTTPDGQLLVTWPDGHVSTYSLAGLRAECRCPVCKPSLALPTVSTSRAVKWTRTGLLSSMYVLPLGLLFLLPDTETVVISGPALVLVSLWIFVTGWVARYQWTRTLACAHLVLVIFLAVLVETNNWSPRRAWEPFLFICTPYVVAALAATWYVYRHPPPSKIPPSWNCRACGYLLFGLSENRCPECNTPFDRADLPTTPPAGVQSAAT
jgi:hypothetical protein